ncbi:hypothetical protein VNO80_23141 [Phaseolus coccineus]|uniref:Uncharacterized protein n=1 Tax=Phaseolus coccineus TaxID=3886 RepID=A0AAN9M736_PHACN
MDTLRSIPMDGTFHQLRPWPLSLKTNLIRTLFGGQSVGDCLDAIFSRSMKYPFFAQFEIRCTQDSALLGMPFLETMFVSPTRMWPLFKTVNDLGLAIRKGAPRSDEQSRSKLGSRR